MIDDHIRDGDVILLGRVTEAKNGDIVAALVGITQKRLYCECCCLRIRAQTDSGSGARRTNSRPPAGGAAQVQMTARTMR